MLCSCFRLYCRVCDHFWSEQQLSGRNQFQVGGTPTDSLAGLQLGRSQELLPLTRTNVLLITDNLARAIPHCKKPDRPCSSAPDHIQSITAPFSYDFIFHPARCRTSLLLALRLFSEPTPIDRYATAQSSALRNAATDLNVDSE